MTTGSHTGNGIGGAIRKGVGMVHGTGENLRGNINAAVDSAAGDREATAKDEAIASRGTDEVIHSRHHRTAPVNTSGVGSKNYGPHDSNVANKADPRFDSDLDHRGTTTASTNYGPHDTNVGNKLDPQVDSDLDHRGLTGHIHAQTDGTDNDEAATTLAATHQQEYHQPKPTYLQPQHGCIVKNLEPEESDVAHHDTMEMRRTFEGQNRSESAPMPHYTNAFEDLEGEGGGHKPTQVVRFEDDNPPAYDQGRCPRKGSQASPHSSRILNVLDPRVPSDAPLSESHSTANPHRSSLLNVLDPRVVSRKARKASKSSDAA